MQIKKLSFGNYFTFVMYQGNKTRLVLPVEFLKRKAEFDKYICLSGNVYFQCDRNFPLNYYGKFMEDIVWEREHENIHN